MAPAITGQYVPIVNGRRVAAGIPEVYIAKEIDNTRLVKVTDHKRQREIYMFSAVMSVVCTLMMLYVWQHFSSIQYGYRIEDQKASVERLQEENRALRLEGFSAWGRFLFFVDCSMRPLSVVTIESAFSHPA